MPKRDGGGWRLAYDGTTYWLPDEKATDLMARGVIVPDDDLPGHLRLDMHHAIGEIEKDLVPLDRLSDAGARGETAAAWRRRLTSVRLAARRHNPRGW
jgi:hypothetical protein